MNPELKSTLKAPLRANGIPENSQWLAGEGAGSWFSLEIVSKIYQITRYSPEGKIECSGSFKIVNDSLFNPLESFEFVHISHCKSVNIFQNNGLIKLESLDFRPIYNNGF